MQCVLTPLREQRSEIMVSVSGTIVDVFWTGQWVAYMMDVLWTDQGRRSTVRDVQLPRHGRGVIYQTPSVCRGVFQRRVDPLIVRLSAMC